MSLLYADMIHLKLLMGEKESASEYYEMAKSIDSSYELKLRYIWLLIDILKDWKQACSQCDVLLGTLPDDPIVEDAEELNYLLPRTYIFKAFCHALLQEKELTGNCLSTIKGYPLVRGDNHSYLANLCKLLLEKDWFLNEVKVLLIQMKIEIEALPKDATYREEFLDYLSEMISGTLPDIEARCPFAPY